MKYIYIIIGSNSYVSDAYDDEDLAKAVLDQLELNSPHAYEIITKRLITIEYMYDKMMNEAN